MPVFEELFAKTDNDKILDKLEEIKQLMIPRVVYVPIYIEQKPWYYCEPLDIVYPETYPLTCGINYGLDICTGSINAHT